MDKGIRQTKEDATGSRVDAVYQALFRAILAQELVPGTKLNEETIGSLFSVSRTIVRAALNRLHSEALVDFQQNRGAFVASTTPEEAREVFEARTIVEHEIFSKLAGLISDRQIDALEQHLKHEHSVERTGDRAQAIALSGEFHMIAAEMAGNRVLADFLKLLVSRTSLILAQHSVHKETDCSVDEHEAILTALRQRDPQASAAAIHDHLNNVYDRANIGNTKRADRNLGDILSKYL